MANVTAARLRCEYLTDPLAIDTGAPRLSWVVESDRRATVQKAYRILAAGSEDALSRDQGDVWDSGKVESDRTCQIVYAGKPLSSGQDVFWKVQVWTASGEASGWSEPARWRMGVLESKEWKAQWVGAPGAIDEAKTSAPLPAPMVRKTFSLGKPIRRAIASVSALGCYELRINGQRVGDRLLSPEWTDYHKRVQYQTYDVTGLLQSGDNVVGAMLGDGWYAGRLGISHIVKKEWLRAHYGKRLRLLLQMVIEFADGSSEMVVTDGSWKSTTDGPILEACILDGEKYDARKEMPGWDAPGYDDSGWGTVDVLNRIDAKLVAQPNEPIRVTEEIRPVQITEPAPGVYVVDFGQNLAGWCRIRLNGKAGDTVRLRFAEVLEPDGNIYRDNLRMKPLGGDLGARQEDRYTLRGGGQEVFEPHFTYHGFRYMEIVGLDARPAPDSMVARVFHSTPPMAGAFACSSALLNQLMKNIVWTHRDNMHSVPTDCPQRDERMGWTGDMLAFSQPAVFNMDMAAFFTKWQRDVCDDQADDGRFPDFAPHPFDVNARFSGVSAWADVGLVVPWRMYVNFGDTRMIEESFESMKAWIEFMRRSSKDGLYDRPGYGDWLNGDTLKLEGYPTGGAEVPKPVFSTAYYFRSTQLLSRMAKIIGREAEAAEYDKLAGEIRDAFIRTYVNDDALVEGDTQAGYALTLDFGLMPETLRERAAERMVKRIDDYRGHISTGFHTTVKLMKQLTAAGRSDVAYKLINNRTMPSWGYTIDHGGTTIWERWDGYVEGRGYQDPAMNSFNHYAIGSVGEWMYRTILGINPDEEQVAYKHFTLRPVPGGGLEWARGSYDSISGKIASDWKIEGDKMTWTVTIPANTSATVYVPAQDASAVTEGGKPAGNANGVKFVRAEDGAAVFEAGSGTYTFVSNKFR